jgi:hypothetical protein
MAKYFCHQDTKTQRSIRIIQTKFFLSAFVAVTYRIDPPEAYPKYSIYNLQSSIPVYPG